MDDAIQHTHISIHSFILFILFILNFGFEGGEKTCKGLAVREGETWEPQ